MVVPTGTAIDRSYEKIIRARATGSFTQITNARAYTDGANGFGTGVTLLYKTELAYGTPIEPTADTGFSDIFAAVSATPIDMDHTASPTVTATGAFGRFLTMMMKVASTASQGITPSETLTFAWDEI